jgi:hypothetical protein
MKLFPSVLATSVLALSILGGCAMSPHQESVAAPAIKISPDSHNISAGTTTRVVANTVNVVGGSNIKWTVSPNVGSVKSDGPHGTTALFTANQPGTYIVEARVNLGDGQVISNTTDVTVNGVDANGRPLTDNR